MSGTKASAKPGVVRISDCFITGRDSRWTGSRSQSYQVRCFCAGQTSGCIYSFTRVIVCPICCGAPCVCCKLIAPQSHNSPACLPSSLLECWSILVAKSRTCSRTIYCPWLLLVRATTPNQLKMQIFICLFICLFIYHNLFLFFFFVYFRCHHNHSFTIA